MPCMRPMLPENLYNRLVEALLVAYPEHDDWDHLTRTALGKPLPTLLNPSVGTREIARKVVEMAFERRRHHEFLTAARDQSEDVELRPVVEYALHWLKITAPRISDPFDACLVGRWQPFINRARLRRFLKELAVPDSSRVLEIEGETGSGKSYSWQFISFISNKVMPAKFPVLINVQPDHTPTALLKEILIRATRSAAARKFPKRSSESIGTWIRSVCGYTVTETRKMLWHPRGNRYNQVWIVLDFPPAGINQEVRDVIYALAEEINKCLDDIRLILLGFPEPLRDLEPTPLRERIPPLDRSQLSDYFSDLRDQHGITAEPEVIDLLLEGILPYANDSGTGYSRKLNAAVAKTVEFLLGPEP